MNSIIKKPRLLRTIILILLCLAFFSNLFVLLSPLQGVYQIYSLWSFADPSENGSEAIFPLCLKISFFLSLIPLGFSIIDLVREKNWGNAIASSYFLAYEIALLIYQVLKSNFTVKSMVFIGFSLAFVLLSFLCLFKEISENAKENSEETSAVGLGEKKMSLIVLVFSCINLLVLFFSLLFVPLFAYTNGGITKTIVFASILASENNTGENSIYFTVNLLLFIGVLLYFIFSLSHFWNAKKAFIQQGKNLLIMELCLSFEFFMLGYVIQYIYNLKGVPSSSVSFIPFLLMIFFALIYSIVQGRFGEAETTEKAKEEETKKNPQRIEPLIYVFLISAVTLVSLWLNIISIHFEYSTYSGTVQLTTLKLLRDYGSLGKGYQSLAFGVVTMYIVSGIGLFLSLAAYFSHSNHFLSIAKKTIYANVFFIFLFGVSGIYFSIATEINAESTMEVIRLYYGHILTGEYKYTIHTDIFYLLLADVLLFAIMIIRKAMEQEPQVSGASLQEKTVSTKENDETKKESQIPDSPIDPCPAFSEIDAKDGSFKKDLAERNALLVSSPSLKGLVRFVVDYAHNSRLHLSYSLEDMADFVAGLGACRLSILQGMSGTGKTSLPKIFSEAIDGNCELVEVESSWKDKNELLGYYNEFSERYTPKKFTQALYKAALNKDIVTFIVLDEMNLSRIEYYFSDFLSLMENEESQRRIKLLNVSLSNKGVPYKALEEGHTLKVPANVYFIGTANRDESTFVISDKVYDRAHTMNFNKRAPKVRDFQDPMSPSFYSYPILSSLFEDAKKKGHFDAENNVLIRQSEMLLAPYNISFGNRILKQMEDYVILYEACFPERNVENEAVERILLSKVVSKLETKTIEDKEELADSFSALHLTKCAEFINKLNED